MYRGDKNNNNGSNIYESNEVYDLSIIYKINLKLLNKFYIRVIVIKDINLLQNKL